MTRAWHRRRDGPQILFTPHALHRLTGGFDQLAAVMAVTLGPTQGPILNALSSGSVELVSDAGTVARRIVEVPDRGRNAGAMILRHLSWQMHERFGDGAATAAVLSRAMVDAGAARIAAGVDPASIARGLDLGLPAALAALSDMSTPANDQAILEATAAGITGDPELAAVLGEIVDLLGPDAAMTIEELPMPYLDREYVTGASWRARPAARAMIPDGRQEIVLENALIMLVDQRLTEFDDVRPALELAMRAPGQRPLVIIPAKIDDRALATVIANQARGSMQVVAALISSSGAAHSDDLGDMAVLTGGSVLGDILGRPPSRLRCEDLGSARRIAISRGSITIVEGAGESASISERSSLLRRRMAGLAPSAEEWKRLQSRVARLGGGNAILKIGAHSKPELAHRRQQAEKAFRVLTGMLADGVVPGGGVACLACVPAVEALHGQCAMPGEEHGVAIFLEALEAPFRQIVHNHGLVHPPLALDKARRLGCGYGFDVRDGTYGDMRQRGIVDSSHVTRGALRLATSAAQSLLTTGAVVLPRQAKRAHRVRP
jgi:chaperonin GroEL